MIEYGDLTDNTGVFFYVNGGTGKLNVDTFNSFWDANTIVNDGKWHMGTFTTDGATTRVYVDGRLDATNAQTFNTTVGVGQGRIGSDFNERHFPGTLDDMRIYNRALTATEIKQLYNAGR